MRFHLPKLYTLTDETQPGVSLAEQVRAMAAGGSSLIQLRVKSASTAEFMRNAAAAVQVAHSAGSRLIVNDRVDIAIASGADGVHLGQDDLPPAEARKLMGERAIIGFSTHSLEQAIAASTLPIDYIAIGPVFSTSTKQNADPIIGLRTLSEVKRAIGDLPLVAIGGITLECAADVLAAGADSIAVISDLFRAGRPLEERTREFLVSLWPAC